MILRSLLDPKLKRHLDLNLTGRMYVACLFYPVPFIDKIVSIAREARDTVRLQRMT